MRVTLLLILFFVSHPLLAQVKEHKISFKTIKIDGSNSDWKNIKPITKNYGIDIKSPHVNIKELAMAMDKEFCYLYISMQNHMSTKRDSSFFKIAIDIDNTKTTGAGKSVKINRRVPIQGFDVAIGISLDNSTKPYYKLLDPSDSFKPLEKFDTSSGHIVLNKSIMELKIPLSKILKKGKTTAKFLFAEAGTSTDAANKATYLGLIADFSAMNEAAPKTADEVAEEASAPKLDISSAWILLIGLSIATCVMGLAVCKKAGLGSGSAYICLLPFIGPFFFMWSLAFGKWSVHTQLAALDNSSESSTEE